MRERQRKKERGRIQGYTYAVSCVRAGPFSLGGGCASELPLRRILDRRFPSESTVTRCLGISGNIAGAAGNISSSRSKLCARPVLSAVPRVHPRRPTGPGGPDHGPSGSGANLEHAPVQQQWLDRHISSYKEKRRPSAISHSLY